METEKVIPEAEELPKAIVRRVVRDTLSRLSTGDGGDLNLHKDALLAFSESARIFIHYLSATANDICKESKRQTINADDVFKALEEIEFPEFVEPLRSSLTEFRKKNSGKRAGASETKEVKKKKKVEEEPLKKSGGKSRKSSKVADEDDSFK
uniref:CCAAT-box binding transcription factor subunit HAP3-related family protein n=1 Tax=Rhizophora mucronata TaxID=61149 RepID=A0A2P2J3B8_RHIMU